MFESIQAKVVAFTAVILLACSTIAMIRNSTGSYSLIMGLFGILISIIYMLILILDQNCVVVGGCDVWGWIKMILTEIWLIMAIVFTIMAIVSPVSSSDKTEETQEQFKN